MYDRKGSNVAQLVAAHELAAERLRQMEAQRAELDVAIAELKVEMEAGAQLIASLRTAA